MPLGTSVVSALLLAGTSLIVALPFGAIGAWHSRSRRWGPLALVVGLVILDALLAGLPRIGFFRQLHWSWQESLLSFSWPFLLVVLVPGITLASIGVTSRFRTGWLRPSLVAALGAVAVPATFFLLGARRHLTAEGWVFLSVMPGLAEELVFRGVFQTLLNRAFGRPWRLAGAPFGWGLIVSTVLFAGFNGLVNVDAPLHPRIVLPAAIAPLMSSLIAGWVRERTDSIWLCVLGHNLSNLVIPLASAFA